MSTTEYMRASEVKDAVEANRKDKERRRLYLRLGVTWSALVLAFIGGVVLDVVTGNDTLILALFAGIAATVVVGCLLAIVLVWTPQRDR